MHGHFATKRSSLDVVEEDADEEKMMNTGIGIVIPAAKIWEVLQHPKLQDERNEMVKEYRASMTATPDSAVPPPA
jgi:hypothetical protein